MAKSVYGTGTGYSPANIRTENDFNVMLENRPPIWTMASKEVEDTVLYCVDKDKSNNKFGKGLTGLSVVLGLLPPYGIMGAALMGIGTALGVALSKSASKIGHWYLVFLLDTDENARVAFASKTKFNEKKDWVNTEIHGTPSKVYLYTGRHCPVCNTRLKKPEGFNVCPDCGKYISKMVDYKHIART